ncbi:MAG TPA: peptidoglycan binding domain-containing protein [Roseiflexaceae bacterium]|nr:peptidoglycan binding domain-containing protein [Roseiflexaceae bacterium]
MSADQYRPDYGPTGARPDSPMVTRSLATADVPEHAGGLAGQTRRPARHTRGARPPTRGNLALNIALTLVVALLAAASAGLYALDRSYQGRIYPNISVQGLKVGDLTRQEAEAALRSRYGAFTSRPATITYGDRTWQPTLAELGITFDFDGAIDSAYRAGRGNGLIANLSEVAAIWRAGLELPLRVSFDQSQAQRYLAAIAAELERPPADAQIGISGAHVWTKPAVTGRQVLVDPTLRELTAGLQQFRSTSVQLQTRDIPPHLSDAAVAAARAQIETILQGPLTLNVADQQFLWPQAELARMVVIGRVPGDGADRLVVTLDLAQIDARLAQIADATEVHGALPRVDWNGGDLKIIKPGTPGKRLDQARARDMIVAALAGRERELVLPMRPTDPPVTEANLHQLGIRELVSVGKSDFTGSAPYRVHNIGVGMKLLHGILLAPGAEFSFNQNIGAIDARNGFVEGAAIVQNRTQQEFGGGICQDSTTIFRAAFWAGLPITERWGHSFYISWYDKYALGPKGNGPGLDATIFTGGPDLKFVNDTGAWLLIQSWSDPKKGVAQVELYGTKPNRTVDLTHRVYDHKPAPPEPVFVADAKIPPGGWKHTDRARGGMTIDVYRIVTENGVQREPELFRTRFRPWPNIYTFNPADLGPDGKPLIPWGTPPPDPNAPPAADPNAQPQPPAADPNAQPQPPAADPNAQPQPPATDPNAQEQSDG